MFTIEESIIAVYCCVDDELKILTSGQLLRSRGCEPKLSDAKVLTLEIVAEYQGIDRVPIYGSTNHCFSNDLPSH